MKQWCIAVFGLVLLGGMRSGRAEVIQASGGMWFGLPMVEGGWEQAWVGKPLEGASVGPIRRAADKKTAPNLIIFVVNADGAGTPAEIEAALPKFVSRDGVEVGGAKVSAAVFGKGKEEQVQVPVSGVVGKQPATLRTSTATLNGKPALIAIVSFETTTNVLVGLPQTDAGRPMFEKIARDINIYRSKKQKPKAPALAEVRPVFVIEAVTATSTKADKKQRFAPARALAFPAGSPRDVTSAWCEGKPDEGVGEALTITFARPVDVKSVDVSGLPASNEIKSVDISVDADKPVSTRVGDRWGSASVKHEVTTVKVTITGAGKRGGNDSCIAVRIVGRVDGSGWDLAPIRDLDVKAMEALPAALTAIQDALFEDGRAKLQPLVAFPFSTRREGARKPVTHKDWKSIAKACAGDGMNPGCPQVGFSQNALGSFLEPTVVAPGVIELLFTSGYQATQEDIWRLKWVDGAWKLVAVDYRTKERGQEGSP